MNVGKKIHGFEIIAREYVSELSCDVYTMRHERCGARLTFFDRDDDNKTFSIAFKTLPEDSSGVFHILEHSVLCGSERYPVKDPFVELLKGSLNTFLNAMTFEDKTMYPVSSRNDKDFLNLVSIYMDAVLHPLVIKNPLAFYQEGWHYELTGEGELEYKGVVLNEMRGDYSSPESVADRHLKQMLYRGTPYAEDSGGDPSEIVKLSYEQFCRAHSTYYHPSNSEIFLDGAVRLEEILPLIDEYLSPYDTACNSGEISIPDTVMREREYRTVLYECKPGEDTENKSRLCEGFVIAKFNEQKKLYAADVLVDVLFSTNESAAKKALLASGLCEDVVTSSHDGIKEPGVVFEFINVKDGCEEQLSALFTQTLLSIAEEGIDGRELTATLNAMEFKFREADFGTLPVGVAYAITSLASLLYSPDPVQNLRYESVLSELRAAIGTGYYEALIKELFVDNVKHATLVMHPSSTMGRERVEREREEVARLLDSMSDEMKKEIAEMNAALSAWQSAEDSAEAIKAIPTLSISDIPPTVRKIETCVEQVDGVDVIYNDVKTSGVIYTELYFDISDINEDELALLNLFNVLLKNLPTGSHSAKELGRIIKAELGSLSFGVNAITRDGKAKIYLSAGASALATNASIIPQITKEILCDTVFDDDVAIKNILRQSVIAAEEGFTDSGHQVALARAYASCSVEAAVREYYSGYEAYIRLKKMDEQYEDMKEKIKASLRELQDRFISAGRLTVGITGAKEPPFVSELIKSFKNSDRVAPVCRISTLLTRREGLLIPARVGFAATAYNVSLLGEEPRGSFDVIRLLVGFEYLWGKIRVRGGAYGTGMTAGISGNLGFYSYRDPKPAASISAFSCVADFLRDFARSGTDLTKYIIGAVGDAEPIRTPCIRGTLTNVRYLRGISYEDCCARRAELLATDAKELLRVADIIERCVSLGGSCIVAGEDTLAEVGELDEILRV